MSDTAIAPDVVKTGFKAGALRAAAGNERSDTGRAGRALSWTALLIAGAISLIPLTRFAAVRLETWTLIQADNSSINHAMARVRANGAPSIDYLEALAELALRPETRDIDMAYTALQQVTKADPTRAHAWARLTYVETLRGRKVTPAALDALGRSMTACPVCDLGLVSWRFNFVLANWSAIPDELRRRAFEQADILRWIGQNREFLAEMRWKAVRAGIPFDEYRAAVNTPAPTWDIAPVTKAAGAATAAPLQPKS